MTCSSPIQLVAYVRMTVLLVIYISVSQPPGRGPVPGRERPDKTTICYKISLVQLII